jgi:uncharacterized protein
MTPEERRIIEDLFQKLAEVDRRSGLREPEADALIAQLAARQPGAAYYMAQAIIAQERALEAAQARIQELEERARAPQSSGGFLSGLFGVPSGETPSRETGLRGARPTRSAAGPWGSSGGYGQPYGRSSGGFLAGAAQTAVGVAGGVMLGSFLADMLTPDAAMAAEAGADAFGSEVDAGFGEMDEAAEAPDTGDMGDDFGSDF